MPGTTVLSVLLFVLTALLVSACGLGMDTRARLDRAAKALEDGEYRAVIIDAKNVLLNEPENAEARALLGRASVEIGDGASAEKELRRAVEFGAELPEVLVDLGRAMVLQGKYDAVISEVDPSLLSNEEEVQRALRVRGIAFLGLKDAEAAREAFAAALGFDANDVAAQLGVVRSYIVEGNFLQAHEGLLHVLEVDDSYVPALLTSGLLAARRRDLDTAIRDYERAAGLARAAGDKIMEMSALDGQADAELGRQDYGAAGALLDRMSAVAPQDFRTLLISARLASVAEDWSKAQKKLHDVLRRAPEHRQAQMLLGYVHKESGNLEQAEMYLSAVVSAGPGNSNARRMLAEIRILLNKASEARQALEPLLTQPSPNTETLSMAAAASLSLREYGSATALLERAVAKDPDNVTLRIQLAFAHYRAGAADKAQVILEGITAEEVGENEFRRDSLLVLTHMAKGSRNESLEAAKDLQARLPQNADAHGFAGLIEMSMGKTLAARKSFETANRLEPDSILPIRSLARLDEIEDKPESARENYRLILELDPDNDEAMLALAKIAARGEDHESTRRWLERARMADEGAVAPRQLLGSLLLAFREFQAAEDVIQEALDLLPKDARLHAMMGHAKVNQESYRDAEFHFGRAVELAPDEQSNRLNLAKAQSARGNNASALVTLQESIELTMSHIHSAVLLASLKADMGELGKAIRIADDIVARYPDEAITHALIAEISVRAGDPHRAVKSYDRALRLAKTQRYATRAYQIRTSVGIADNVRPLVSYLEERPLNANMRIYLAQAYQVRGEVGKANEEYQQVLNNEPDNFIAANNLAWNYYQIDDARAEELARRAYEIEPNSGAVVDTLGWILIENGAVEEGVEILHMADQLTGGRPDIRFHLAAGLAQTGREDAARKILEDILGSDVEFSNREAARQLLSAL